VERHVTAALDLEDLDATRAELFRIREKMRVLGRPSQCDHRRMLDEQQQVLVELSGNARACGRALQL